MAIARAEKQTRISEEMSHRREKIRRDDAFSARYLDRRWIAASEPWILRREKGFLRREESETKAGKLEG